VLLGTPVEHLQAAPRAQILPAGADLPVLLDPMPALLDDLAEFVRMSAKGARVPEDPARTRRDRCGASARFKPGAQVTGVGSD